MIRVLSHSGRRTSSKVPFLSRAVKVRALAKERAFPIPERVIATARGIGGGRPPDAVRSKMESRRAEEVKRCAAKGWKSALVCIDNMRKGGVSPGTQAYNIALKTCTEAGEWEHAVTLLGDMRAFGAAPNAAILSRITGATAIGSPEQQHDSPQGS